MQEIALFSGEIYTTGLNFTRPSVVTVATNINSVHDVILSLINNTIIKKTLGKKNFPY